MGDSGCLIFPLLAFPVPSSDLQALSLCWACQSRPSASWGMTSPTPHSAICGRDGGWGCKYAVVLLSYAWLLACLGSAHWTYLHWIPGRGYLEYYSNLTFSTLNALILQMIHPSHPSVILPWRSLVQLQLNQVKFHGELYTSQCSAFHSVHVVGFGSLEQLHILSWWESHPKWPALCPVNLGIRTHQVSMLPCAQSNLISF